MDQYMEENHICPTVKQNSFVTTNNCPHRLHIEPTMYRSMDDLENTGGHKYNLNITVDSDTKGAPGSCPLGC